MAPYPVFLPGESQGQKSPAGYSPQGHRESNTTEHTHTRALAPQRPLVLTQYPNWKSFGEQK